VKIPSFRTNARILSLCDRSGVMVEPWAAAGAECVTVDIEGEDGAAPFGNGTIQRVRADIRTYRPAGRFDAVFAFPPCTHLAASGARWWQEKGVEAHREGLSLVLACLRIIAAVDPKFWILENPIGRLTKGWRKPDYTFDPCDFARYSSDPEADAYTKNTCLWASRSFAMPEKRSVDPVLGSKTLDYGPSAQRRYLRSITPKGFANAVFESNQLVAAGFQFLLPFSNADDDARADIELLERRSAKVLGKK
jgi:hypothetical protein